jgi:hypothetical protein
MAPVGLIVDFRSLVFKLSHRRNRLSSQQDEVGRSEDEGAWSAFKPQLQDHEGEGAWHLFEAQLHDYGPFMSGGLLPITRLFKFCKSFASIDWV